MKMHRYLAFTLIALACGVTPKEGSIPLTVGAGNVVELIATAKDAQGRVLTSAFTWHSADETKATVNSLGVVDALAPGLVTISAETAGIRGGLPITVN